MQGVLDLLPRLLVELAAGEQGEQALAEGGVGAGQPGPQALQPATGRLGRSSARRLGQLLDLDVGRRLHRRLGRTRRRRPRPGGPAPRRREAVGRGRSRRAARGVPLVDPLGLAASQQV